jgi:hypothetical protein
MTSWMHVTEGRVPAEVMMITLICRAANCMLHCCRDPTCRWLHQCGLLLQPVPPEAWHLPKPLRQHPHHRHRVRLEPARLVWRHGVLRWRLLQPLHQELHHEASTHNPLQKCVLAVVCITKRSWTLLPIYYQCPRCARLDHPVSPYGNIVINVHPCLSGRIVARVHQCLSSYRTRQGLTATLGPYLLYTARSYAASAHDWWVGGSTWSWSYGNCCRPVLDLIYRNLCAAVCSLGASRPLPLRIVIRTDRLHLVGGAAQGATPIVTVCLTSAPNLQPRGGVCKQFQHQRAGLLHIATMQTPRAAQSSKQGRDLVASHVHVGNVRQGRTRLRTSRPITVAIVKCAAAAQYFSTRTAS